MSHHTSQPSEGSITARTSADAMRLGRTSGQRTAEMVAGLRYELSKTPLNQVLSRFSGRTIARMMLAVMRDRSHMNYILARPAAFKAITRRYVPPVPNNYTLVEIAAGFSPRGIEFAQEMHGIQVIEVDLPDVVEEKQRRLTSKDAQFVLPPNIKWYKADLGVESLASVLGGQLVDVVSAEGLNPYFGPEEITRIASHVRESLKPGGVYISDIGWEAGRKVADEGATQLFSRQASRFLGVVASEEEGRELFLKAGYERVEFYKPTEVVAALPDVPTTPQDYSVIFVAHKASATP